MTDKCCGNCRWWTRNTVTNLATGAITVHGVCERMKTWSDEADWCREHQPKDKSYE